MRFTWKAALALASVLVSPAVHAAPSLLGPVGNVLTPSADTLGRNTYAITLHHQPHWNVLAGSYSPREPFEVGVMFLDPTRPGERKTHPSVNLKWRAVREGERTPAVAIGVADPFGWLREGPYSRSIYGVASKDIRVPRLAQPMRVSLGGGTGNYKHGFCAVAVPLHPMASAILEFDGTHINPGARVHLPRGFVLDVAAVQGQLGLGAAYGAQW